MVNVNAQEYINQKYPINGACKSGSDSKNKNKKREDIIKLDLRKGKVGSFFSGHKNLISSLKLEGFANLKTLTISSHHLVNLDVSDCPSLEELDCRSNQLVSLNVKNCSNLKKIDCSNNNLKELDLSTCAKLEEVDINRCLNLTENTIKSNLYYDIEKSKLVRDNLQAKISPQIRKVADSDIRNILIIGITGNGKSTLANVLTSGNKFEEKSCGVSVTKNFQVSNVFEWEKDGKKAKYRIIDNIGFGDTSITEEDILFKIGEGIHSAKEGINQVLFVVRGRFSRDQIKAFNMFEDFVSETGITKFTTIVKTGFEDFQCPQLCKEDHQSLLNQTKELSKIINSCNSIIHVNNPPILVIKDDDNEKAKARNREKNLLSEKKRKVSKKIVLDHLVANCSEIYKLKEWDSIYSMVENYNRKKEQIEQSSSLTKEEELKQAKAEVAKEINKGIKASVGVEVPGLPIGLNASIEYNTQKKF